MKELDESIKELEDLGFLENKKLTPEERSNIISMVNSEFLSPEDRDELVTGLNIEFWSAHSESDGVSSKKEPKIGDLRISKRESDNKLEVIQPKIIDNKQKFEAVLSAFPEIQLRRGFVTNYREVGDYYENGMMGNVPSLVKEIDGRAMRRLYEDIHGGPPEVRIESMRDVDRLLKKYPKERKEDNFQERYRKSIVSFEVRDNHSMTNKELVEIFDIPQGKVSNYLNGKETTLISRLRRYEENQILEEWKLTDLSSYIHKSELDIIDKYSNSGQIEINGALESSILRINSSNVLDMLDLKSNSVEDLTSIASEIYQELSKTSASIAYLKIKDFPALEETLQDNRKEIERKLRHQLSDENVRVGIVEGRVYVWTPNITSNDMINVWSDRIFHFKTSNLSQIILDVEKHLQFNQNGYETLRHLNILVKQVVSTRPTDKILIRDGESKILGEILHLQCDILGVSPRAFEDQIERVTGRNGHGGIIHPKLLRGAELEILRARLGAIINSDCWLGEDSRLMYSEADIERIEVVKSLFQQLGDMPLSLEPNEKNNSFRMWIPKPVGNAFIYWGFTFGDKPIQNKRLPNIIREGSLESYKAYLEDLISEDGSFDHINGFRWSRTIVLKLGTNDTKYSMESKLSQEQIQFLARFKNARRDSDGVFIPITRLRRDVKHLRESEAEIVKHILEVVKESRSKLLDDEALLAENLGIKIQCIPEFIVIYNDTGRISLKWVATTEEKDDAIIWALIASPNDPRKNGMVQRWLLQIPDDVERTKEQLQNDELGYLISSYE